MNEENKVIDGVNFVMRDANDTNEVVKMNEQQQVSFESTDAIYEMQEERIQEIREESRVKGMQEELEFNSSNYKEESNKKENNKNTDNKNTNNKKANKKKVNKKNSFVKKAVSLVASAAVFGIVAGVAFQGVQQGSNSTNSITPSVSVGSSVGATGVDTLGTTNSGSTITTDTGSTAVTDVSGVVANVMPSIVAINSTVTQTTYDFFGREYNQEGSGSGSGIIIAQTETELLIATNNHVVEGATKIEIVFDDDSKASATIKGTESSSDLAVVAVLLSDLTSETKENIRIATLGDSEEVKIGEMAIAIGNALGYGQSVTVGYISALDREVTVDNITLNLLQTDAAINPGNSGGALLNASGEIIGINSVKYTDTSVEGIGYAIPISSAIPIINDLMNREVLEEGESGYLGITYKPYSDSFRETFSMPEGVYIYGVAEGSPAKEAGLHQGDIITSIGGKSITNYDDLKSFLSYTKAGSTVEVVVEYLENGAYVEKTLEVTLTNRPTE